ncbi:MAG: TetR/AcrR family transcriptional regulator [Bacteroidota bacterium]|uniref:TetR/AcrR family transcriptional regulator n=1 Tax=Pedobacter cryotolerans TaxID=2571270 RepID=A0A4U1C939_9SPHI|nr:TetR/AcrR family transcriptional regulator [Pedobacter cryotolerans]TKC01256.1 TetR/AcrR family transcriptional regulator [Pedobacter cryotolerans]
MAQRDTGTEQLIKDTAKRIFFSEGKLHATTQDIADAAGVNRTLLNYYFRSRDILFEQVAIEAREEMSAVLDHVFTAQLAFKEKLQQLINVFMDQAMKFPYREVYIVTELNRTDKAVPEEKKVRIKAFLKEISEEMDAGKIKKMDPRQFLMNLFSLMAYPLITNCLNKSIYNINDNEYLKLMKDRKKLIFEMIYQ